jgi:tetratricopeptide (TPR) repeat protein
MSGYEVARLDEIDELDDGRCPLRPMRHHLPLYEAGDYAAAADRGRELAEAYPHYVGVLYNLACCESLAGRTADALEHLRQGVERSEQFRAYAKEDSDFDPIRHEPAFKELVGS